MIMAQHIHMLVFFKNSKYICFIPWSAKKPHSISFRNTISLKISCLKGNLKSMYKMLLTNLKKVVDLFANCV